MILRSRILFLSLGFAAIGSASAIAQSAEPSLLSSCTNCWPLSSAHPGSLMAPDGAGGTYVIWMDGSLRWRLQRLRADLTIPKPWPATGLALTAERQSSRIHPLLTPDGSGGVYVAWTEQATNGDMSVWLLRVRSDGRPARGWPDSGVAVSRPIPFVSCAALVRRRNGAAVAWLEGSSQGQWVRVAAFDANGRNHSGWPANGLSLDVCQCTPGDAILLASDGRAGLFVAWTEMRGRLSDLKVTYTPDTGTPRTWTMVSQAVPPFAIQMDDHPEIVADGLGGAIFLWGDERSRESSTPKDLTDAFGQRVSASGQGLWTPGPPGNHPIAAGLGYQMHPHVVSDGKGGAFFSWDQQGPFATASGRVQHLDSQGRAAPGWPADGIVLGLEVPALVSDLEGGAFAIWTDSLGAHLQRFESAWTPDLGATEPLALGPTGDRTNVRIASDGRGGVFMAWEERSRNPSPATGYGQFKADVRIQHVSLETRVASPILPLPTEPMLAFAVHPIAPNPARSQCRIAFDLPRKGRVAIDVFDVAGRRVARLADGRVFEAGAQSVSWDLGDRRGQSIASGLYFVRVVAGRDQGVVRITVTR